MASVRLISAPKEKLLKLLLEDPRISQEILVNGEIPQSIVINDDGSVTFGRTPRKWWNWIFQDKTRLSFRDLAFEMRNAFAKYTPKESMFAAFMKDEIVNNAVDARNYDFVIDRFVANAFLGVTEGDYLLSALKEERRPRQQQNASGYQNLGRTNLSLRIGNDYMDIPVLIQERP